MMMLSVAAGACRNATLTSPVRTDQLFDSAIVRNILRIQNSGALA